MADQEKNENLIKLVLRKDFVSVAKDIRVSEKREQVFLKDYISVLTVHLGESEMIFVV